MFRGQWLIHQWEFDLSWEKNQKKMCQLRKKYSQKKKIKKEIKKYMILNRIEE